MVPPTVHNASGGHEVLQIMGKANYWPYLRVFLVVDNIDDNKGTEDRPALDT